MWIQQHSAGWCLLYQLHENVLFSGKLPGLGFRFTSVNPKFVKLPKSKFRTNGAIVITEPNYEPPNILHNFVLIHQETLSHQEVHPKSTVNLWLITSTRKIPCPHITEKPFTGEKEHKAVISMLNKASKYHPTKLIDQAKAFSCCEVSNEPPSRQRYATWICTLQRAPHSSVSEANERPCNQAGHGFLVLLLECSTALHQNASDRFAFLTLSSNQPVLLHAFLAYV